MRSSEPVLSDCKDEGDEYPSLTAVISKHNKHAGVRYNLLRQRRNNKGQKEVEEDMRVQERWHLKMLL